MDIASFASDVWTGMTKGVQKGKKFRIKGNEESIDALKKLKKKNVKPSRSYVSPKTNKEIKAQKIKNTNYRQNSARATQPSPFGQKLGNFVGGGIRDTYHNMNKKDMKFGEALKKAHYKDGTETLSKTKMAGTYIGVSAAGRVATGGGVMKDKNGNTNVIGIPFI